MTTMVAGRYRLEERIASGSLSSVWRGMDEMLDRVVAVKVQEPWPYNDDRMAARFLATAQAQARGGHRAP